MVNELITEHEELPCVDSVESNGKVCQRTEQSWNYDGHWEFTEDSSEEVWAHFVHIIVNFSQEYWSFIWEHKDDVLDRIESNGQGDEEESTVSVLDT